VKKNNERNKNNGRQNAIKTEDRAT